MTDLNALLANSLDELGIALNEATQDRLLAFLDLLAKWNKAYNLTAIRDKKQMLIRHIVESLSLIPYIYTDEIADIGTGPGLPGIPLAIAMPERRFTLLDSNGKKTRFLNQVKIELGLDNVTVVNARIEDFKPSHVFTQVLTRAFADIATTLKLLDHVWSADTCLSLMKGPGVKEEIQALNHSVNYKLHDLKLPGQEEYRCLLEIRH